MGTDLTRHREVEAARWRSLSVTPAARGAAVGPGAAGHHVPRGRFGSAGRVRARHLCQRSVLRAARRGTHDRRCLVVDRPGCGFSDRWPEPTRATASFETFADRWLVELLDALELDAATIVSTSFGGLFALRAVAAHPDRFVAVKHLAWSAGAPIAHVPLVLRVAAVPSIGRWMTRLPLPRFVARSMLKQIGLGGASTAGRIGDEFFDGSARSPLTPTRSATRSTRCRRSRTCATVSTRTCCCPRSCWVRSVARSSSCGAARTRWAASTSRRGSLPRSPAPRSRCSTAPVTPRGLTTPSGPPRSCERRHAPSVQR